MTKEKTAGIVGTIIFHAIILLLLFFYYMQPANKDAYDSELGGVPVMLGNAMDAFGTDDPVGDGNGQDDDVEYEIETDLEMPNNIGDDFPTEMPDESPTDDVSPKPAVSAKPTTPVTQEVEETATAADIKKAEQDRRRREAEAKKKKADQEAKQKADAEAKKKKANQEAKQKAEAEANRRKAELDAKAKADAERKKNINSQMAGLFGKGSSSGNSGTTTGSGTQGSPSGNGSTGKLTGVAGLGSYDLGGRGLGAHGLVMPTYNVDDYGTVVVDIIVDPQGNVIEANIGKGTTTANGSLRTESIRAAKRTKFSIVKTTNNQRGTITYKFSLN